MFRRTHPVLHLTEPVNYSFDSLRHDSYLEKRTQLLTQLIDDHESESRFAQRLDIN